MPISNYSVLAGRPTAAAKVYVGSGALLKIAVEAEGGPFTVAVNVQSTEESEILYSMIEGYTPPNFAALSSLPQGLTAIPCEPGGLALDYLRQQVADEPMCVFDRLTRLPRTPQCDAQGISPEEWEMMTAGAAELEHALRTLTKMTSEDKDGQIYAFGRAFANSKEGFEIREIHMNQGNPAGGFKRDNGIWQDGALFFHVPSRRMWVSVLIAFHMQSGSTDSSGHPV